MSTKKRNREELQLLRDDALQAYLNRADFQYDMNADALYRQYKDRYMELGRNAMKDTMGQAASLTGGYGSSYAQNVGQQAYQGYLKQLGDVVPELYKLAYDRYQDQSDKLYKAYQSWSQLEQEAAQQEQQDREYALAERKRQDANAQFQLELESKNSKDKTENSAPASDYYAWLSYYQGAGSRPNYDNPTVFTKYDNQNVSTGNIMAMQRALGLKQTGMWTINEVKATKGLKADDAWAAYQKGQLQNRISVGLGEVGLSNENVKAMERALGLKQDGYWSKDDIKAAGGLTEATAWEAYRRGLLQLRR